MKNITAALLGVQKKLEAVAKSSDNPYFKSKYADLNAIIAATKPLLNEAGIMMLQPVGRDTLGDFVETQLIHSSGETVSSKMYLTENAGQDMQKLGAAVTYARRYGLQSLLVMESEDDDGETAVGRGKTFGGKPATPKTTYTPKATTTATTIANTPVTVAAPVTEATTVNVAPSTPAVPVTQTVSKTSSFKRPSAFSTNGSAKSKGAF